MCIKIRWSFLTVLMMVCMQHAIPALAHESFQAYVRHDVLITARPSNIDIQIALTFYGTPSLEERRAMDSNRDGRITGAEVKDYLAEIVGSVRDTIALRVDGRSVHLLPLYEPELDLLGQDSPTPHPHVMRIFLYARTPNWLAEGSVISLEENLWAQKPSIRSIYGVGGDGVEVGIDTENSSLQVTAARGSDTAPRGVLGQPPRLTSSATRSCSASDGRIPSIGHPDFGSADPVDSRSSGTAPGQVALGNVDTSAAVELVGKLLREHPWLLDEQQRAVLDDLNRQLREAASRREGMESPEGRAELDAAVQALMGQLLDLLGRISSLVHVSVEDGKARRPSSGAISLPGDVGAVLLRVEMGTGEPRFATSHFDMVEADDPVILDREGNDPVRIPVDIAASGATWALVSLENVPAGRSSLSLWLTPPEGNALVLPVDVLVPDPGRLKVTILSADSGEPTPAMVRLVWRVDGRDRKPSNAIELRDQFDMAGYGLDWDDRSGRRGAFVPGPSWVQPRYRVDIPLRGFYWVVPGPFDMALPPGEWEITVRRGLEHIPVFETIVIEEGKVTEKTYRTQRWVDMREHGWYSGDDHVHARILSDRDADNLMTWTRAEDVHVANILKMGDIHRTYFQQRGFGKELRVVQGDYVLVPGQEDPRTDSPGPALGHVIALNIKRMVREADHYFLYDRVFDEVHAQGGLVGYAHIGWGGPRDMSMNVKKIDFVEMLHVQGILETALYYEFLDLGFKLTASAGSDVPWGRTIGEVRMYAYLGDQPFSADAWFDAVGRGRTFVTHGPMIDFRVEEALPGDEIRVGDNRKLQVRARAWGHPERVLPGKLEIIRHGEVIRAVEPTDAEQEELHLDFEIETDHGFWIAARAEGKDGTRAHTTPIYVIREPLRFWKSEAVEELIAKRMASLDQVETMVARAQGLREEGKADNNRPIAQLALQGPELLERVAAARTIYEHLKKVQEQEREVRDARPTIEITSPENDDSFDPGESVLLRADARSYGRTQVDRVEFFVDGARAGSDGDTPYTFNWTAAEKGRHSIKAKIYDSKGRTSESSPVTIFVGIRAVERSVIRSTDDAEEQIDGSMYLKSPDLELINEAQRGDQVVGMRFVDIRIPKGAQIKRAYLQFTADEVDTEQTDLTIHAELAGNAEPFGNVHCNITSRQKTRNSVEWSPELWTKIGERLQKQRTPDLSALIQEVIAQPGWKEGNALVFIINGSGKRVAESYDYNGALGSMPLLYIEIAE